ncbi:hypothetical protein D3C75_1245240 [compost metagenome]
MPENTRFYFKSKDGVVLGFLPSSNIGYRRQIILYREHGLRNELQNLSIVFTFIKDRLKQALEWRGVAVCNNSPRYGHFCRLIKLHRIGMVA